MTPDFIQFACPLNFTNNVFLNNHLARYTCPVPLKFPPICCKPRWKVMNSGKRTSQKKASVVENGGRGGRDVQCEVEVVSWRERKIRAELLVNADVDSVWKALTDYERLADFVPNLVSSGRIPCPHPGRIWLEQRGLQRALYWHIEARVVLDLQELQISENHLELHFSMVEGDFKKFEGKWLVRSGNRPSTASLSYEVNVIPTFNFSAIFLERIIRSDLPVNLLALAYRSECDFVGSQNGLFGSSLSDTTFTASVASASLYNIGHTLENKKFSAGVEMKDEFAKSTFGPLSPATSELSCNLGVLAKVCKLNRPRMVDEVHLRRFDGLLENGGAHRGVVASITVKAPVHDVWITLTSYEKLPEIVPNLAISKVLSRENNKVRILQEGCKGLLYMVLHARVVLDLREKLEEEISFRQVEGDFDFFQGKWTLEQLGSHHTLLKYVVKSKMHRNSFLSEAIMEEVIYEDLPSNLCAIRDYIEDIGGDDSSDNLSNATSRKECDVVDESSCVESAELSSYCSTQDSARQRPRVPGLQRDIEVLKSELLTFIAKHGQEGFMPMRKQLREHGRVDIEKAIARMGGFRKLSSLMNLSFAYKQRKPKGYWDNLENLEEEINRFQRSWGMDPSFMPSRKSFERAGLCLDYFFLIYLPFFAFLFHVCVDYLAVCSLLLISEDHIHIGRYDIARALEKWGGLHEVSRLLSLKVRHPKRKLSLPKEKMDPVAPSDVNGEQPPSKLAVSQNTEKWLTELKDFDINWVE